MSGLAALLLSLPFPELFRLAGHAPEVLAAEIIYTRWCVAGSVLPVFCSAMGGWLSGIGRTSLVTVVTLLSFLANAILAWMLVLGRWGAPELGLEGAALATLCAQGLAALLYAIVFARGGGFSDRAARRLERAEFLHFLRMAVPQGLRISGELLAWTLFLVFVGRLGTRELAASSIVFRINGMAFFPAIGMAQAAAILVGQARGAGRDQDVPSIGWQALCATETWMAAMAALFLCDGTGFLSLFAHPDGDQAQFLSVALPMLRFVAFYCLFDAANIVLGFALSAAGDTRWVAVAFLSLSGAFIAALWTADHFHGNIFVLWTLATLFIFTTAMAWTWRFHSGRWRVSQVIQDSRESSSPALRPRAYGPNGPEKETL
jgi:MATE family multidrug resistance protein